MPATITQTTTSYTKELPSEIIGRRNARIQIQTIQETNYTMAAIRTMSKQAAHQTEFWLDEEHTTSTCVLIAILLGFFGVLLVKKSVLGRHGDDNIDKMGIEEAKVEEVAEMCCASCGITRDVNDDNIKLKKCTDFDLVRYCSDKCKQEHQTQHEAISKDRTAELRDEILFRQ